jgi:hypothetical protein
MILLRVELGSFDAQAIQDCNCFGYSKTRCKSDTSCMHEQENASRTSAIDICKNEEQVLAIPFLMLFSLKSANDKNSSIAK